MLLLFENKLPVYVLFLKKSILLKTASEGRSLYFSGIQKMIQAVWLYKIGIKQYRWVLIMKNDTKVQITCAELSGICIFFVS